MKITRVQMIKDSSRLNQVIAWIKFENGSEVCGLPTSRMVASHLEEARRQGVVFEEVTRTW